MTPIQIILSVFIFVFFLYSLATSKVSRKLSVMLCITSLAGFVFVWAPGLTEVIAHWLGVGRGVDLILYTALSLNSIMLLFLHLRIHTLKESITGLSRELALMEAEKPDQKNN
jgi:small membrane protein